MAAELRPPATTMAAPASEMAVEEASDLAVVDSNAVAMVELVILVAAVDAKALVVTAIMGILKENEKIPRKSVIFVSPFLGGYNTTKNILTTSIKYMNVH